MLFRLLRHALTLPRSVCPYARSLIPAAWRKGKVSPEVIPLTFQDAIDLGLKNNLGVLLQSYGTMSARGAKWKELSALLPNLSGAISENVAQQNLAAEGLRFPGFPTIVGPYGYFDARVYLTQSVFNLKALNRERGAAEDEAGQPNTATKTPAIWWCWLLATPILKLDWERRESRPPKPS